jgi:hypothetical protein
MFSLIDRSCHNFRVKIWESVSQKINEGAVKWRPLRYLGAICAYEALLPREDKKIFRERVVSLPQSKSGTARCDIREVLFLPEYDRANTGKICLKLAEGVEAERCSFLLSDGFREDCLIDSRFGIVDSGSLFHSFLMRSIWFGFLIWLFGPIQIKVSMRGLKRCLAAGRNYSIARMSLQFSTCKLVVTPNERLPLSSAWIAAASSLGIASVCFLHGIPTALYKPVFCDELWGWGEADKNFFDDDRVISIGAMEFANSTQQSFSREKRRCSANKSLLILSQIHGDHVWGVKCFSELFESVARALSNFGEEWCINVRLHPSDSEDDKLAISSIFDQYSVPYSFSESRTLHEDVRSADAVCTVSSSAIFESLIFRRPAFVFFGDEAMMLHGDTFLPKSFCAEADGRNLFDSSVIDEEKFLSAINFVLGDYRHSVSRGVERILACIN